MRRGPRKTSHICSLNAHSPWRYEPTCPCRGCMSLQVRPSGALYWGGISSRPVEHGRCLAVTWALWLHHNSLSSRGGWLQRMVFFTARRVSYISGLGGCEWWGTTLQRWCEQTYIHTSILPGGHLSPGEPPLFFKNSEPHLWAFFTHSKNNSHNNISELHKNSLVRQNIC